MQQCHGASLETQLQKYILEPLQSLNYPYPLVVVVDALDEWRDHPTFVQALAYLNFNTPVVKIIATSRLNPVASHLPGISEVSVQTYHLLPVSTEVMKAYFEKHLKPVPWVDGRIASPGDVDKLAELSGGLPVWAATVISLLSHRFSESPPHEILSEIVGSRRQVGGSDGLGELYRNALKRLFITPDIQKHFRRYFGAIIALQASLSLSDFSTLIGIPMHLVNNIQATLPALQTRSLPPGSEKMVHPATTLYHLSLLEHVQATATETCFTISTFDSHNALGLSCLEQLTSLPSPSPQYNSPLRAIQHYAVKYWPYHVSNGTPRSNNQWSRTEHYSRLQAISASTQRQWATLFYKSLMPGDDESRLEEGDSMVSTLRKLADHLDEGGGDHWGFRVACLEVAVRIDDSDSEGWSDLGKCYDARGDRTGNLQMHEEAVVAFRYTLQLRPDPHPNRADSLDDAAGALWSCYQLNGNRNSLSEAILCSRMALTLSPISHPNRDRYLNTLANALINVYDCNGDLQTLNETISLYREALELRPEPHPHRSLSLDNLALALHNLHERDEDIDALNEAISLHRQGLALCPAPHPGHSRSLNNLANALQSLHEHDGNIDAVNEAISLHREALALRPASHPHRSKSLVNLANALDELCRCNGDDNTLNEAISLYHEALALCPAPHPERSISLNNLAFSLQARYKRNGDISTLNECLSLHCEALALRPAPHPDRPMSLDNLANALLLKFEQNRDMEVLDEAISLRRELLILRPPGHRYRAADLKDLIQLLEKRDEVTGDGRNHGQVEDLRAELAALDDKRED